MAKLLLTLDNMESYLSLFGMNDRNMAALEQELDVAVALRGQELNIQGDGENVALAEQVIGKLIEMLRRGEMIDGSRIRYAVALAREGVVPPFNSSLLVTLYYTLFFTFFNITK